MTQTDIAVEVVSSPVLDFDTQPIGDALREGLTNVGASQQAGLTQLARAIRAATGTEEEADGTPSFSKNVRELGQLATALMAVVALFYFIGQKGKPDLEFNI